jgi:hypothetical protein
MQILVVMLAASAAGGSSRPVMMESEPVCIPDPVAVSRLAPTVIPRRIIQTWKTTAPTGKWKDWHERLQQLHPTFEYLLFNDAAIERFIAAEFPDRLGLYRGIRGRRLVQRFDLFRMMAIYKYGGFYFDMDVSMVRSLEPLLNESAVFPFEEYIHAGICHRQQPFGRWSGRNCDTPPPGFPQLGQFGFGAAPGHAFVRLLLDGMFAELADPQFPRRYYDVYILSTTGPDYVSRMYDGHPEMHLNITVLHDHLATPPDEDKFKFGIYGKHEMEGSWR